MSKAQVVISHTLLSESLTMEVDRDLLTYAIRGRNTQARNKIVLLFKERYLKELGRSVTTYLPWDGLGINETEESTNRPQGCGCKCAGCDQGYHCCNEQRGCYL